MKNIYRAYFYAYPSKFGKVQNIQEKLLIDLSKNEGQGLAFRRGVDFDFLDDEKLHIIINSNLALTIRVEYKTFDSYNEAEETQYLSLKRIFKSKKIWIKLNRGLKVRPLFFFLVYITLLNLE